MMRYASSDEKYAIPTEFTSYLVLEPGMRQERLPVPYRALQ